MATLTLIKQEPSLRKRKRGGWTTVSNRSLARAPRRLKLTDAGRIPMTNRLRHTVMQLGWLNASLYLLGRVLEALSGGRWRLYRYLFVAQHLPAGSLCATRGRDIEVRLLPTLADLPPTYPRPPAVLRRRYAQGAQSLAAFRGAALVGFLWFLFDGYQEDEVRARYQLGSSRSVWDFDVWVRPEDRLGWAFRRLWDSARQLLRQQSVYWSCSRISAFNPGSISAHARIGTVRLGSATFVCCGGWQWMVASQAPYFHLSRNPASFPRLLFDTSNLADLEPKEPSCPISNPSA